MKRRNHSKRKHLYSSPSFLRGFGSILNLAGSSKSSKSILRDFDSDFDAIMYDWQLIGWDFKKAMKKVDEEAGIKIN
jgi:hypothetical protein